MSITIKVEGAEKLERDLAKFPKDVERGSDKGLVQVARPLQTEGKERVPLKHGYLSNAIEVVKGHNKVEVGVVEGETLDYAEIIDRGGYELGERSKAAGPQVGPHYMDRAWDDNEQAFMDLYERRGIDPVVTKFNRG